MNAADNIIVADRNNSQVRQITPAGVVTTLIDAMSTPFSRPSGIAYDTAGNLYVSDIFTNRIQRVEANGSVTSVAASPGAGTGSTDGPGSSATFN